MLSILTFEFENFDPLFSLLLFLGFLNNQIANTNRSEFTWMNDGLDFLSVDPHSGFKNSTPIF